MNRSKTAMTESRLLSLSQMLSSDHKFTHAGYEYISGGSHIYVSHSRQKMPIFKCLGKFICKIKYLKHGER